MARKTVDRTLADRRLAKKKSDKKYASLPYMEMTKGELEKEYKTIDKILRERRTPKKLRKAITSNLKRAGTNPKAKHPGRAYPKPKGKIGKIGRGGKVPAQHPADQRKKFPQDWKKRLR